jgi:hypothetical protein
VIRRLSGLAPARLILVVLAVSVAVGALAVSVPVLGNAGMLLASVGLLAALAVLAQWLWQSRQSTDWDNSFTETSPPRGADSRISRLAVDIRDAGAGDPTSATRLHAAVTGLATERLRDRRGLTGGPTPGLTPGGPMPAGSAADDTAAALGPDLAAYLAGSPTIRITAAQLAAYITTLEEL